MTSMVQVVCPSPSCPGRIVEGESVTREAWEATWCDGRREFAPYWHADISCPACGTEGVDPESGQLDSAEEELGTRCPHCGLVSAGTIRTGPCRHCGKPIAPC